MLEIHHSGREPSICRYVSVHVSACITGAGDSISQTGQHWTQARESTPVVKGRHGSGIKGNFESGQNKSKACSYIFKDRECNPLFVTMDTSCKLYFKRDNILQLRTSNSFVDCQLHCPPLTRSLPHTVYNTVSVCASCAPNTVYSTVSVHRQNLGKQNGR